MVVRASEIGVVEGVEKTGAMLNGSLPELIRTKLAAPVTPEEAERSHILQTLNRQMKWPVVWLKFMPPWLPGHSRSPAHLRR
jgi:hypothetical protein